MSRIVDNYPSTSKFKSERKRSRIESQSPEPSTKRIKLRAEDVLYAELSRLRPEVIQYINQIVNERNHMLAHNRELLRILQFYLPNELRCISYLHNLSK